MADIKLQTSELLCHLGVTFSTDMKNKDDIEAISMSAAGKFFFSVLC